MYVTNADDDTVCEIDSSAHTIVNVIAASFELLITST